MSQSHISDRPPSRRIFRRAYRPLRGSSLAVEPTGPTRSARFSALCRLVLILAALIATPAAGQPRESLPQMMEDAQLCDVHFLDAERGFAVGDRGVIWQTTSGGRHWHRVNSPATARLNSVFFVDERHGWIAGGWIHPLTHRSSAVLLRTTDGGETWLPSPGLTLPALQRVKFFDPHRGWAVSHPSAMYPTGLFRTTDGGRSWSPVPGNRRLDIAAADFVDMRRGALATRSGVLEFLVQQKIQASPTAPLGARPMASMALDSRGTGWLVGAAGLVLRTEDGGLRWTKPRQPPPPDFERQFDFAAVATWGDHCWISGTPGSCILHTADAGRSWEILRTGRRTPLRGLAFVDSQRGWAVGDLGTILATHDGGRTWTVQREGGRRVASLAIYATADRVPWEVLAHTAGSEGYLSAVEVIGRHDWETQPVAASPLESRIHAAAVSAAASVGEIAWNFPLRQPGLQLTADQIVRSWSLANDGPGDRQLEQYLVRKIRQWQPEILFTEEVDPRGKERVVYLLNQIITSAASKAADPTEYPDQIAVAGLAPWRVKRIFSVAPGWDRTGIQVESARLAPQLGTSLEDYAGRARTLVSTRTTAPAGYVGRVLLRQAGGGVAGHDFYAGLQLAPGGEARRRSGVAPAGTLEELTRLTQKRRNIQKLLEVSEDQNASRSGSSAGPFASNAWLGQIGELTQGLNSQSAGDLLFELASRFEKQGQFALAADALESLVQQHPQHPFCEAALDRLVRYYSSGEQAWRTRRKTRFAVQKLSSSLALESNGTDASQAGGGQVRPASRAKPINGGRSGDGTAPAVFIQRQETTAGAQQLDSDRAAQIRRLEQLIQRTRPSLYAEPSIRFPMASAARVLGEPREAEKFYHALAGQAGDQAWRQAAEAELWLTHRSGPPPKSVTNVHHHSAKPRLDGKLDDAIWLAAERMPLTSALHDDSEWPAEVLLARDDEFLYIAIQCARTESDAEVPPAPRPRDGDLSQFDRVTLLLDTDRDYQSFFRLTIDSRGWTSESCLGDPSWNPQWFVATNRDSASWTAEAAIPLAELSAENPKPGTAWALGVQRVVPRTGFQSWTRPATAEGRGEGFGLLIF